MSELAKMFAGITLLIFPAFALFWTYACSTKKSNTDQHKTGLMAAAAHSVGFIVLALLAQLLLDNSDLQEGLDWVVRFAFTVLAFLMTICNMSAAMNKGRQAEFNRYRVICLVLFCFSTITLGIGLVMR